MAEREGSQLEIEIWIALLKLYAKKNIGKVGNVGKVVLQYNQRHWRNGWCSDDKNTLLYVPSLLGFRQGILGT